jgi:7,8-dihydropterin-6-yl-methyl-4-(beta-D-ribofuranosyl)aminobenzene 5'-phosphate synthase
MALDPIDQIRVTTVVDNSIDALRRDDRVARRFSGDAGGRVPTLRAEHGLAHYVEVTRAGATTRIAFDFGLTAESMNHNWGVLGLEARDIDLVALSHGHVDHYGGLIGFLERHRGAMRREVTFYGGSDHFAHRWSERNGRTSDMGALSRRTIEAYDVSVRVVVEPQEIAPGVMLSGEMTAPMPYEVIPATLRVEEHGELRQDTFIGEQTLIAHVKDKGLVVVTSCSHRGIVGICKWAARVSGVSKIHAVIGGFHLSGLDDARIAQVTDAFDAFELDYIVPQHCTGFEALVAVKHRLGDRLIVSSVGSTFTFAAPGASPPVGG